MSWYIHKSESYSYRDEVINLHKAVFDDNAPEKEDVCFWEWEFINNYYGEAEKFIVLNGNKKVIGFYGILPQVYSVFGSKYTAGLPVDAMISPKYRRKGIFSSLQKYALENTDKDFLIGYTKRKEILPAEIKGGFVVVKNVPVYVYPICFKNILKKYIKVSLIAKILGFIPQIVFETVFHNKRLKNSDYQIKKVNSISDSIGNFFEIKRYYHDIFSFKDRDYLNWRFDQAPLVTYDKFIISDLHDNICGYYILRARTILDISFLNVVDLELIREDRAILNSIINNIISLGYNRGNAAISFQLLDNGYISRRLKIWGFIKAPYKMNLIMKNIKRDGVLEKFSKSKKVLLNLADTDLI